MSLPVSRRFAPALLPALLDLAGLPLSAAAQVERTLQGGMRLGATGVPGHAREQGSSRPAGARAAVGEATTAGARIGVDLSERWLLDGGLAWSHSTSRDGAGANRSRRSGPAPCSPPRPCRPGSPTRRPAAAGRRSGAGAHLRARDGTGATRRTNVGGLATVAGRAAARHRLSIRLDAQQYWFSAAIGDSYTPHLGTTPVRPSGAALRHDFVLLAGISWRTD
jgi:hypothetical protein